MSDRGKADPPTLSEDDTLVAREAFRRGASVDEALGVLISRRATLVSVPGQPTRSAFPAGDADRRTIALAVPDESDPRPDLRPALESVRNAYVLGLAAEFASLSDFLQRSFRPLPQKPFFEKYVSAQENYRDLHEAYYRFGLTCPRVHIFDHIVPATFFGLPVIGGVHRRLLPVLADTERVVKDKSKAEAAKFTANAFSIGGFVPRRIADKAELSNHAFGMALDVDPTWNPNLKEAATLAALLQMTGTDFSTWLFDWEHAGNATDRLASTRKRIEAASVKLKAWLRVQLPSYDQDEKTRAELAGNRSDAAKARLRDLDARQKTDRNRISLLALINGYGLPTVRTWADFGIVTLPPEVVAAFVASTAANT